MGKQAQEIVAAGGFLPDDVMLQVVTSKLAAIEDRVCSVFRAQKVILTLANTCMCWFSTGFLTAFRARWGRGRCWTSISSTFPALSTL